MIALESPFHLSFNPTLSNTFIVVCQENRDCRQNNMLLVNIPANHDTITFLHVIHTMLTPLITFYKICLITFRLHVNDLTFTSGGVGDGGGIKLGNKATL